MTTTNTTIADLEAWEAWEFIEGHVTEYCELAGIFGDHECVSELKWADEYNASIFFKDGSRLEVAFREGCREDDSPESTTAFTTDGLEIGLDSKGKPVVASA